MFCEKCGSSLPSNSYICPECGRMLSNNQIKILKEMEKEHKNRVKPNYLSEIYGVKRNIVMREKNNSYIIYIIAFVSFLIFLLLFLIFI